MGKLKVLTNGNKNIHEYTCAYFWNSFHCMGHPVGKKLYGIRQFFR